MRSERYEADQTTAKERISFDKLKSLKSLIFGQRAKHFDAFLDRAPDSQKITMLSEQLQRPDIRYVIFDLGGTLLPPYAPITNDVVGMLNEHRDAKRNVGIYTNSPHSDRLNVLRYNGIPIAETGIGKPTLEGFQRFCDAEMFDPKHTAMVGNFPLTDMPLVPEGEPPFFSLNVLVESIPPQRELVESRRRYYRARVFHAINKATARIVQIRNPHML